MILSKNILPEYFEIASPINSHYKEPTNTFDFINYNSKKLVVTIGESWTYGSELCNPITEDDRLNFSFGNLIAKELNADWLNLSQPGSSNFWMAKKVEEFGKIVPYLNYQKIYLICVFTEIGRSFDSQQDRYIDYIRWFKENLNFDHFLKFLNTECVNRITQVTDKFNIQLKIGTNFVDATGIEHIGKQFLPIPWFRLLGINSPTCYTGPTGILNLSKIKKFIPEYTQSAYLEWFDQVYNTGETLDRYLNNTPNLVGAQHPSINGHKIWADYVLFNLKNK